MELETKAKLKSENWQKRVIFLFWCSGTNSTKHTKQNENLYIVHTYSKTCQIFMELNWIPIVLWSEATKTEEHYST